MKKIVFILFVSIMLITSIISCGGFAEKGAYYEDYSYDEGYDIEHINSPTDVEIYSKINSTNYGVDIKNGPDNEKIWEIFVKWEGSSSETIELNWDVYSIPYEEYNTVILYDLVNQQQINMRSEDSYDFILNVGGTRHLEIKCLNVENNPPLKPQSPSGPINGRTNINYDYTAVTTDPDGNTISYIFSWDDGTTSQSSFLPSGEQVTETHSWSEQGTYEIKVKAIDENGAESEWSEPLSIAIPKNKACSRVIEGLQIFQKILPILYKLVLKIGPEKFPNLFLFINRFTFNQ